MKRHWTAADIRAYGVVMPTVKAIEAVLGFGPSKGYELLATEAPLPFPVIRVGRRAVTPTAAVLRLLGISDEGRGVAPAPDRPRSRAVVP